MVKEPSFPAPKRSTRREQWSRLVRDLYMTGESSFPAPEYSTRREQRLTRLVRDLPVHDTRVIVPGSRTQYTTRTSRRQQLRVIDERSVTRELSFPAPQYTSRTSRRQQPRLIDERSVTRESSFPIPKHSTRREQRSRPVRDL